MEIKLSAGDKITIPTGCKATIEENLIIIEEQEEFKDGDILKCIESDNIVIFKNRYKQTSAFRIYFSLIDESHRLCLYCSFRHATEEEKQRLFDKLKEEGLRWNAETKQIEKIRKRAKRGEKYLFITGRGEIVEYTEDNDSNDDASYDLGNYYLLSARAQAEEDAQAVKAIYEKRLKVK